MTKGQADMDQLDKLPMPALLAFGGVLAVIFYVRYWGVTQGARADPAKNPAAASVAAVIVDATALNRLTDEGARVTSALHRLAEVGEDHTKAVLSLRDELYIQREIRKK
jgi:hypothetical protein